MSEKEIMICPYCGKEGKIERKKVISLGTVWAREKRKVLRSNYKCQYCGKRCVVYSNELLDWSNPKEVEIALEIAASSLGSSLGLSVGS